MPATFELSLNPIDLTTIERLVASDTPISIGADLTERVIRCREFLDAKLQRSTRPIYGINTGFGSLYNKYISAEDTETLQDNLLVSHACGIGDEVPTEIVKLMLLLKIRGLSYGNSGVQLQTIGTLIEFYNHSVFPIIYQQGSLGASGDLAPLAHLSLPLLGLGEVLYNNSRQPAGQVIEKLNIRPVKFKSKEALALLNGTQFMSSYASSCIIHARHLADWADTIAAISLDAFDGRPEAFSPLIQTIRPHIGQQKVAANILNILKGSELLNKEKEHVQDPYSFRCIPQVHGASRDTIEYVASVVTTEINAVTDNPTVFPESDEIISGGNFHGQPLALALDFLAIAISEIGNISERRTYQLISGARQLPSFLVSEPGLNSGFMIPQYTAASIVSQNKQLCTPASIDSIVSSNGQEDHVSMGANAATKCYKVVENAYRILGIELLTAVQALEFRRPLKSSPAIEALISEYRKEIPFLSKDRLMYPDMNASVKFLKDRKDLLIPLK